MTPVQLSELLDRLLAEGREKGWIEFKHNKDIPQEIGEYLSALSNSAVLENRETAYLVWGVQDGTQNIVGTTFQPHKAKKGNESLENWLTHQLDPQVNFKIHSWIHNTHPVVLFEIPRTTHKPVAFGGIEYIRIGSHKKKLKDHDEKERELWRLLSAPIQDWSAQVCQGATLGDLAPAAVTFARSRYKEKHLKLASEVDGWDDLTFLNKVKVTSAGQLTRAAVLLLGKEESVHYLSPAAAQITWILKDANGVEIDYAHFGPPFLLNVDEVYKKIRNLTLRALSGESLFPKEITKFDDWVIREALHNCIAHQDYTQGGRINVVEADDSLLFTNMGSFLPGTVENVIDRDAPEETYRNRLLAEAMVNLNMIDTIGSGIKRMFRKQKERYLPMPDFDFSDPKRVKVRIIGKILDERFTRLLISRTDLDLVDVIVLDKVQKRKPINEEAFRSLKRRKLIEGRKTAPFISAVVAAATGQEAEYIYHRGSEKDDCKRKVLEYLRQFGNAVRKKIEELLFPMLSTALNERQKRDFVKNLIQEMKREGLIHKAEGERSDAVWVLSKTTPEKPG